VWWVVVGPSESDSTLELTSASSQGKRQSLGKDELEPGYVMVGGVKRPITDIRPAKPPSDASKLPPPKDIDYGTTQPVPPELNPQVKSVVEAVRSKKHPERLSVAIAPKPFDRKAWQADPQTYLDTVEPGRVFQTAQPGPDVPAISAGSPRMQTVVQGQSVTLKVQAPPGAPVTFTSFDLGEFENRLTSITVKADEQGVAQAKFYGTPGTIEDVNLLVGSPMASGQVKYIVNVQLPSGTN